MDKEVLLAILTLVGGSGLLSAFAYVIRVNAKLRRDRKQIEIQREIDNQEHRDAINDLEIRFRQQQQDSDARAISIRLDTQEMINKLVEDNQTEIIRLNRENSEYIKQNHELEKTIIARRHSEDATLQAIQDARDYINHLKDSLESERNAHIAYIKQSEETLQEYKDRNRQNIKIIKDQEQQIAMMEKNLKSLEDRFGKLEDDLLREKSRADAAVKRAQKAEHQRDENALKLEALTVDFNNLKDEWQSWKANGNHLEEKEPETDGTTN